MFQRRMKKGGRRLLAAPAILAALLVVLTGCNDDATGVDTDEGRFLEEIYPFDQENDIAYGSAVNENGAEEVLLLDMYLPRDEREDLRPAVVWLHGGSFQMGHKGEMTEFARRSAQRGYVAASANYRLRENQTFSYTDPDDPIGTAAKVDAQHDVQAAVRWLRENAEQYRIDPNQIYLVGYSAGGTAALRASANPDDPGSSGNPDQPSDVSGVVAISGYPDEGVLEAGTPTLLIHGEADTRVPVERMEERCSPLSTCELVVIPGAPHNMISSDREQIIEETAAYLHGLVDGS